MSNQEPTPPLPMPTFQVRINPPPDLHAKVEAVQQACQAWPLQDMPQGVPIETAHTLDAQICALATNPHELDHAAYSLLFIGFIFGMMALMFGRFVVGFLGALYHGYKMWRAQDVPAKAP